MSVYIVPPVIDGYVVRNYMFAFFFFFFSFSMPLINAGIVKKTKAQLAARY